MDSPWESCSPRTSATTPILTIHRSLLEEMAEALMASRDMDRIEAEGWLARVRSAAPEEVHDVPPAQTSE